MKVLVTGATGFIGSAIVEALLKEGHAISALVRRTSKTDFLARRDVGLIRGDVTDVASLDAVREKFDAIVHCAAYVIDKDPEKLRAVNIRGTENICRLSLRLGIGRMVYLSSVAVVSGNDRLPLTEDLPFSATNLYGRSKIEAEKKVLEYRAQGLRVAILRPSMVYGEGEPHLLGLIMRLLKFRLLFLPDQGRARWHLSYVRHVAEAARLALHDDRFLKESFFVADREVLSCAEIFSILAEGAHARPPVLLSKKITNALARIPLFGQSVKSLTKERIYDLTRIQQAGYAPALTAQQALRATGRWYAG